MAFNPKDLHRTITETAEELDDIFTWREIVVGLATGGTGLIVIGIVALTGAGASKAFGDISGDVAGGLYDIVADK